jgi:hypothetical protein
LTLDGPQSSVDRCVLTQTPLELVHEVHEVGVERAEPGSKLDDVDPPGSGFDLADGGLPASQ